MGKRLFFALLLTIGACQAKQRTMLVVQVDSNMAVPTQLNKVDVAITVNGITKHWPYSLISDYKLPLHVGVVEASDGAGDITIVASGYLDPNSTAIVSETAIVGFVEGDSMELKLYLASECIAKACDPNKTCTMGGNCRETTRQPSELTPFVSAAAAGGSSGNGGSSSIGGNSFSGGKSGVGGTSGGGGLGGGRDAGVPDAPGDGGGPDAHGDAGVPDAPGDASLAIDKVSLPFGSIDIGSTSDAQTVTVTNTGTQAVAIVPSISSGSGAFTISSNCASVPVATGAVPGTCQISITFAPTTTGKQTAILTITSTLTVALSGTGVPAGSFAVANVNLGSQVLTNTAVTGAVTVTITGNVTDLACSVSGADLTADPTRVCPAVLAAGTSCSVGFIFKSVSAGARSDSVMCDASGQTKTGIVTATVIDPAKLAITPPTGSFQTQSGTQSASVPFGVANVGGAATGELSVFFAGSNADQFAITVPGCLAPLAGGGSCSLQVVCKPTSVGTKTASLSVADSSGAAATVTAALTCVSVGPASLTVTGTANLGSVVVGSTGTPQNFTVKNTGATNSGTLTATISDTADFVKGSDGCNGTSLDPNATCSIVVSLHPASAGALSAVLSVTGTSGNPGSIQLAGVGLTAGALTVSPPSYDFGPIPVNSTAADVKFTVTNGGGAATGALTVSAPGNGFVLSGNACSAGLAPAQSCVFTIHFAPSIVGNATATVTVGDGTVFSSVALHGTGVGAPTLTISPSPVTFPTTVIGQTNGSYPATTPVPSGTTFTVTNSSSSPSDTGALAFAFTFAAAGDFAVGANNCPATLSPGSSCTVVVNFTPTAAGDRAGVLQVTSVNGGSASASLDGLGLPFIEVLPCSLQDGSIAGGSLNGSCTPLDPTQGVNFGEVPVGVFNISTFPNQEKAYVVKVRGSNAANHLNTLALVLNSSATPADFRIASASTCNGFQADVSLGLAQCVVYVDFYPQSYLGARTATLTITGSGGGSASVNVMGTAVSPLILSPSPVSFGSVSVGSLSTLQTVTVTNYGGVALGPISLTITGANASDFLQEFDNCSGGTLPAGSTCSIVFGMKPTLYAGAKTATLTVIGGTFSSQVTFVGTGL